MSPQQTGQLSLDILVVEDNIFLRNLLCETLQSTHKVCSAGSIKEGLQLYLDKAPDIVFLDINLPDGSGHDLARQIKQHGPGSFIVMATANDHAGDKTEAKVNGVDGFIIKPFDKKSVNGYIDLYLATRCHS